MKYILTCASEYEDISCYYNLLKDKFLFEINNRIEEICGENIEIKEYSITINTLDDLQELKQLVDNPLVLRNDYWDSEGIYRKDNVITILDEESYN